MMTIVPVEKTEAEIRQTAIRDSLQASLAKPLREDGYPSLDDFNPWGDVIKGIDGDYSSECDAIMIAALEAVRDDSHELRAFRDKHGLAGEMALYILSGHRLTEYGVSPLSAFPDPEIEDLWQTLIDKWRAYAIARWGRTRHDHPRPGLSRGC